MAPGTGTIHVVDDDAPVRQALGSLLRSDGLHPLIFASADEFLAGMQLDQPACLILDIRLQRESGFRVQQDLAERGIAMPIIYLTGHATVKMGVDAIKSGAYEFLTKPFDNDEMLRVVHKALVADAAARRARAAMADVAQRYERLTAREREVMQGVVNGLLNKQVAAELGTSEITVKVHRRHAMEKMQARSLPELVLFAAQLGLVQARSH
jgi:FixJ family two-component response regulator